MFVDKNLLSLQEIVHMLSDSGIEHSDITKAGALDLENLIANLKSFVSKNSFRELKSKDDLTYLIRALGGSVTYGVPYDGFDNIIPWFRIRSTSENYAIKIRIPSGLRPAEERRLLAVSLGALFLHAAPLLVEDGLRKREIVTLNCPYNFNVSAKDKILSFARRLITN